MAPNLSPKVANLEPQPYLTTICHAQTLPACPAALLTPGTATAFSTAPTKNTAPPASVAGGLPRQISIKFQNQSPPAHPAVPAPQRTWRVAAKSLELALDSRTATKPNAHLAPSPRAQGSLSSLSNHPACRSLSAAHRPGPAKPTADSTSRWSVFVEDYCPHTTRPPVAPGANRPDRPFDREQKTQTTVKTSPLAQSPT